MKICVVGGGIIGLSIAFELAQKKLDVVVVDAGFRPGAASPVAGGMLEPLIGDLSVLEMGLQSLALYPDFIRRIEDVSPLETGFQQSGLLYFEQALSDYDYCLPLLIRYDFKLEALNEQDIKKFEPDLRQDIQSAVYSPQTAQIEPKKTIFALYDACAKLGVDYIAEAVTKLTIKFGKVAAVQTAANEIKADFFVIAAGAWSTSLLQSLGINLPAIKPVKGQIITLRSDIKPNHVIHDLQTVYIIPRLDDRITVGATVEHEAGFDLNNNPAAIDNLKQQAVDIMPALKDAPIINAGVGFRPFTGSDQPLVDHSNQYDNLLLATGHHRSGILLAPWTAKKIAALLTP